MKRNKSGKSQYQPSQAGGAGAFAFCRGWACKRKIRVEEELEWSFGGELKGTFLLLYSRW